MSTDYGPVLAALAQARADLVRAAALSRGDRVAVLCAGQGAEAAHALHAVGPEGAVVAIDTDAGALDALHEAFGASNLHVVHGDALEALAGLAPVDACFCCFGTHYLGVDEHELARRVGSRLRAGGVLARLDWLAWGPVELRQRVAEAVQASLGVDLAGTPLPWNEAPVFRGGHRDVAWADTVAETHAVGVVHPNATAFWEAEQATGAWRALRRRVGPLAFDRARRAVHDAIGTGRVHQELRFRATLRRTLA